MQLSNISTGSAAIVKNLRNINNEKTEKNKLSDEKTLNIQNDDSMDVFTFSAKKEIPKELPIHVEDDSTPIQELVKESVVAINVEAAATEIITEQTNNFNLLMSGHKHQVSDENTIFANPKSILALEVELPVFDETKNIFKNTADTFDNISVPALKRAMLADAEGIQDFISRKPITDDDVRADDIINIQRDNNFTSENDNPIKYNSSGINGEHNTPVNGGYYSVTIEKTGNGSRISFTDPETKITFHINFNSNEFSDNKMDEFRAILLAGNRRNEILADCFAQAKNFENFNEKGEIIIDGKISLLDKALSYEFGENANIVVSMVMNSGNVGTSEFDISSFEYPEDPIHDNSEPDSDPSFGLDDLFNGSEPDITPFEYPEDFRHPDDQELDLDPLSGLDDMFNISEPDNITNPDPINENSGDSNFAGTWTMDYSNNYEHSVGTDGSHITLGDHSLTEAEMDRIADQAREDVAIQMANEHPGMNYEMNVTVNPDGTVNVEVKEIPQNPLQELPLLNEIDKSPLMYDTQSSHDSGSESWNFDINDYTNDDGSIDTDALINDYVDAGGEVDHYEGQDAQDYWQEILDNWGNS